MACGALINCTQGWGETMSRLTAVLLVSTAMLFQAGIRAQDHDHDGDHDRDDHAKRYYDTRHKDYHEWNSNEDRAYHEYWENQHKKYRDYDKASKRQQEQYWDWRHDHPDSH
jgi:hypothetical protein